MSMHGSGLSRSLIYGLSLVSLSLLAPACSAGRTAPAPVADTSASTISGQKTAVFAGGCFWGVEAVFEHVNGVSDVVSGFSGGSATAANYETVSSGQTGHAEAVKVTYDPAKISYDRLLQIYFRVAHDPTELNRQGPDSGTQYRSAIFFTDNEQKRAAQNYIAQLEKAHAFTQPIVTQVVPLKGFYAAEDYHQNFIARNPSYPYVVVNDLPKIAQLQASFPSLYRK